MIAKGIFHLKKTVHVCFFLFGPFGLWPKGKGCGATSLPAPFRGKGAAKA
jgi:hypothetical protein